MAIVAVTGDVSTTTSVALASAWPTESDSVLVEADPTGGDLAAWFGLEGAPTLSSIVTRPGEGSWPEIQRHTTLADCGLRLIPAPAGAAEAHQAVSQSSANLVPTLAALASSVAIVDTGASRPPARPNPFVMSATVTVVVHRQWPHAAGAAAVRLRRLVDQVETTQATSSAFVVVVVGGAPFGIAEISDFLTRAVGDTALVALPVDDLTAAVYAGRTGVSPRRLGRLPLARAARSLADSVGVLLADRTVASWSPVR
jgi:MinD-like ATPase involved in chromosome partitioning or flagellar assembly